MQRVYTNYVSSSSENVFKAMRLTPGNLIFPSRITTNDTSITMRKPHLFKIVEDTLFFVDILSIDIERYRIGYCKIIISTKWGNKTISNGYKYSDALSIKSTISKNKIELVDN